MTSRDFINCGLPSLKSFRNHDIPKNHYWKPQLLENKEYLVEKETKNYLKCYFEIEISVWLKKRLLFLLRQKQEINWSFNESFHFLWWHLIFTCYEIERGGTFHIEKKCFLCYYILRKLSFCWKFCFDFSLSFDLTWHESNAVRNLSYHFCWCPGHQLAIILSTDLSHFHL